MLAASRAFATPTRTRRDAVAVLAAARRRSEVAVADRDGADDTGAGRALPPHDAGGRIVLQLWHVGRVSHPGNHAPETRSVGPSSIAPRVRIFTSTGIHPAPSPHELSAAEVAAVVQQYANGARNAIDAGFDGVEIHAGNGYLVDPFLPDSADHRTDS